ncbi:MAG: DUF3667 domain-containing protein [Rhodocyclaceae bacterium]|nr:MAG: DUF3667 domain-containing protein [Rhodocyclaceae bacterium]
MSARPNSKTSDNPHPGETHVQNCLNCGTLAPENYCPHCGQETLRKSLTVADYLHAHFIRYATRQGVLWQTFSKLFFVPGALTVDYLAGKRARYMRPLQLYLTASVIVFATAQFFGLSLELRLVGDNGIHLVRASSLSSEDENTHSSRLMPAQLIADNIDSPTVRRFKSLSKEERFQFLRARRVQYVSSFVLLLVPIYAVILKICYIDRRRRYSDHLIFGFHAHSFLLFMLLVQARLPSIAADVLSLWVIAYFVISLRRVYGGTWIETLGRSSAMFALYSVAFFVCNLLLVLALLHI